MAVKRAERGRWWMAPLLIALVTFVAFLPGLQGEFLSWDDERNFLNNPHYRGLGLTQLRWMWSTFLLGHYVPLSWMTLGLDYTLWGMNPLGYHLTNLLLHAANAIVVYVVARRLLRISGLTDSAGPAALAALLFAVHPLRVESVTWITERRDVLSGLFYSLSLLAYFHPERGEGSAFHPERGEGSALGRSYWLAVFLFICALLSKGTSVSLPAVLLVLNVYPLRRLGGDVGWSSAAARRVYLELVPFALLAGAIVVLSIVALRPPEQLPPAGKLAVSAFSLGFYLLKSFVPIGLSPLYEMPQRVDPFAAPFLAGYVAVIGLVILGWVLRRHWPGAVAAGVVFVLISLPMLGIVQNGPQIAADRYTYHAAPALAMLVAAAIWRLGSIRLAAATVIVATLAGLTWRQTGFWHDSERLWSRVLAMSEESSMAHSGMAGIRFKQNRIEEGMAHSLRAVELAPNFAEAHNDVGVGLARQRRLAESFAHYQRAIALKPGYDEAESNWGVASAQLGLLDSAVSHFQRALATNPDNPDAHVNWGNVLVRVGRTDDAIAHYRQALWIRPDHADAEHNWGVALARAGRLSEAIEHFRLALAMNADHVEARDYLDRATQLLRNQRPADRPR
jgi:tetratricopeptide (TPR) repeat protein